MHLSLIATAVASSLVMSGCLLESIPQLPKYQAPFGAYFIKPGMTREERLQDIATCGGHDGLSVRFTTKEVEEAERSSKIAGDFFDIPNNNGYLILYRKFRTCMTSKRYHEIQRSECEGDQEYQPRCMWP
jgi:hypothetical protein